MNGVAGRVTMIQDRPAQILHYSSESSRSWAGRNTLKAEGHVPNRPADGVIFLVGR